MSRCTICSKSVGMVEERKACNKIYHVDCFKCGGANSDGCKKKLTLDSYSAHSDEPYCKTCYGKLFGPKGYGAGSITFNTFVDKPSDLDKVDVKNDRHTKVTDHIAKDSGTKPVGDVHYRPPTDGLKCNKCHKSVGLVEQRLACDKTWHSECFTCGGVQTNGCKKRLTLDSYVDHDKDPYCKTCYGKLWGTKGFIGASLINSFVDEFPTDRLVNDRNVRAIETEKLPQAGGVKAAMAALKKELPNAQ